MRNTLYRQMVYCINAYRTWIEVADDNLYKEHIISRTDRTDYLVSRTLVLRAFKTNGIHAEGTTWTIPEHELDKALAIYRLIFSNSSISISDFIFNPYTQ